MYLPRECSFFLCTRVILSLRQSKKSLVLNTQLVCYRHQTTQQKCTQILHIYYVVPREQVWEAVRVIR